MVLLVYNGTLVVLLARPTRSGIPASRHLPTTQFDIRPPRGWNSIRELGLFRRKYLPDYRHCDYVEAL